jgi:hypothetical protein
MQRERERERERGRGWRGEAGDRQSIIRICSDAFTPDTARPSFRKRSFNCGLVRVLISATRCGTSVDDCEDAMVEILRDGDIVKRNAMRPGQQSKICADTSQSFLIEILFRPLRTPNAGLGEE